MVNVLAVPARARPPHPVRSAILVVLHPAREGAVRAIMPPVVPLVLVEAAVGVVVTFIIAPRAVGRAAAQPRLVADKAAEAVVAALIGLRRDRLGARGARNGEDGEAGRGGKNESSHC